VNNVIFELIDIDPHGEGELSDEVWDHVMRVRQAAMDAIRYLARPGRNFRLHQRADRGRRPPPRVLPRVAKVAADRGALLLPVRLAVDADELARRIASPERAEKLKLTNPDVAVARTQNEEVFRPEGYDYMDLDVTTLAPEESARLILAELEQRQTGSQRNRGKAE
jgi:hypothetical protein